MGEIPKKEQKPVPTEKTENTGISALFSSPSGLPLLLCASAAVLIGGVLFYTMTRPSSPALSDITRSPLGFDVGQLEDEETTEEEDNLLADAQPSNQPSNPISF